MPVHCIGKEMFQSSRSSAMVTMPCRAVVMQTREDNAESSAIQAGKNNVKKNGLAGKREEQCS